MQLKIKLSTWKLGKTFRGGEEISAGVSGQFEEMDSSIALMSITNRVLDKKDTKSG